MKANPWLSTKITVNIIKVVGGCESYQLAERLVTQGMYELCITNWSRGGYSSVTF